MPLTALRSLLCLLACASVASAAPLPAQFTAGSTTSSGSLRLDAKAAGHYALDARWTSSQVKERLTGTLVARRLQGQEILEGSVQRAVRKHGFLRRTVRSNVWVRIVGASTQRPSGTVWVDRQKAITFRAQGSTRAPTSARASTSTRAPRQATVVPRGLNLRRSSTSGSGVITTLSRGTTVDVLDTSREPWWLVSAEGRRGYVHSNYLRAAAPPSAARRPQATSTPASSVRRRIRAALNGPRRPRRASSSRRPTGPPSRRRVSSSRSGSRTDPSGTTGARGTQSGSTTPNPGKVWDGKAIRFIPAHSRNYTRSSGRQIRTIVIHTIEGSESSGINWFKDPKAHVSAHYVVSHAGRVTQMVKDKDVAHHVRGHNSNSIGIENEGNWKWDTWTQTQMKTLARLVAHLCDRYGIPADRRHIRSHGELDPARRSDPGPHFKWDWFIKEVRRLQKN